MGWTARENRLRRLAVDVDPEPCENAFVKTAEKNLTSTQLDAQLDEAIRRAMSGIHDPEVMRQAAEDMDRLGEEIRKRHGVLNIGVPAIRELRGELPAYRCTCS